MKHYIQINARRCRTTLLAAMLGVGISVALASPSRDELALAKGAMEDVTPQQKYNTAIREAGGGYKEWLRECNNGPAELRRACTTEAKATYDRDMRLAKSILTTR